MTGTATQTQTEPPKGGDANAANANANAPTGNSATGAEAGVDKATHDAVAAQRDLAMRENAALRTMLGKHNIPDALDANALATLRVDGGKVVGEYAYTPPAPRPPAGGSVSPPSSGAGGTSNTLTRDDLAKLSHAEIEKRWDEVKTVLAQPA